MTRPPKTYPSKRFMKLMSRAGDASFEAGDWNKADAEEDYDEVHARVVKADLAIANYVASLERARDAVLADIAAFRRKTKREEYTDTGEAWETFEFVVATLRTAGRKA